MREYPKYKDSGVEWIGEIPEHWERKKVKNICEIFGRIGYRGYTINDIVNEDEGVVTISPGNIKNDIFNLENVTYLSFDKYYESPEIMIFPDDLILVKTGSTIGKTSIIPKESPLMTINPQLIVLKNIKINNGYLYYQTTCDFFKNSFEVEQTGSTTPTISQEKVNLFPVLEPSLHEQQQIVNFLDQKTSIIDDLIQKKQRKIELLKEHRTCIINQTVTKGLNPDVKMKDSGVEWIGEIPEHWNRIKLKFVGEVYSGDSIQSELIQDEGDYPVYGGNGVLGYFSSYNYDKPLLSIGRVGEKCGNVHLIDEPVWINDNSLILDLLNSKTKIKYLFYTLLIRDLNKIRNQNTQPLITGTLVKNEYIPYPPYPEQTKIVEFLDNTTTEIDTQITLENKKIDLLKEFRQSLISEVVTGKIDVRQN